MAKQTFTTGQVLTAAQVTALQTNGYNQTVTTVTTNYTLLAADVGTRVYMNAAGATTITVNTGVFAAGDTVWLGNIGAGSCVVTAGTATVSKFSTASLTLSQYQGAYLYFVSTGVAILYSDSAGASTPLTTKGDLFGYDTANARIPIGTNNQVLTADSAQALGLKWATPSSGSETLISTTSLSGASTTISSIPSTYTHLRLLIKDVNMSSTSNFDMIFNGVTSAVYGYAGVGVAAAYQGNSTAYIRLNTNTFLAGGDTKNTMCTDIYFYNDSKQSTRTSAFIYTNSSVYSANVSAGGSNIGAAITSIGLGYNNTMNGGTAVLYGVK
jgi:hypothetical protein